MIQFRPTIDETLINIAFAWEARSTCSRNHVGAVIALEGRVIGSGYNGTPAGMPHCDHGSIAASQLARRITPPSVQLMPTTPMDRGCKESIHAEANALAYSARHGVGVQGATVYTTLSPCYACSQLIIAAGLMRVVYARSYRDPSGIDLLKRAGLDVLKLGN
ncbi:MAG: dCMP deaminase family protein [Actinoplanes sp.]